MKKDNASTIIIEALKIEATVGAYFNPKYKPGIKISESSKIIIETIKESLGPKKFEECRDLVGKSVFNHAEETLRSITTFLNEKPL